MSAPPRQVQRDTWSALALPPKPAQGSPCCIVDSKWVDAFVSFINGIVENPPGPIDNTALEHALHARPALRAPGDYSVMSEAMFDELQAWYGGGPKMVRKVAKYAMLQPTQADLYSVRCRIYASPGGSMKTPSSGMIATLDCPADRPIAWLLDELHKLGLLEQREGAKLTNTLGTRLADDALVSEHSDGGRSAEFNLAGTGRVGVSHGVSHARLPHVASPVRSSLVAGVVGPPIGGAPRGAPAGLVVAPPASASLSRGAATSSSATIPSATAAAAAAAAARSSWWTRRQGHGSPSSVPSLSWVSSSASGTSAAAAPAPAGLEFVSAAGSVVRGDGQPNEPGAMGLQNLGNTCFMNAAIQCLTHLRVVRAAFGSSRFESQLNVTNVLGAGGRLAKAFGDLLDVLWSGAGYTCAPRHFKAVMSNFAPRFTGFAQQDAAEFFNCLLDGLHEDMNRATSRPFIEAPSRRDFATDADLADQVWINHLMRNDSIIVDHFQGQIVSRLACSAPGCNELSITFEPAMFWTLPLPHAAGAAPDSLGLGSVLYRVRFVPVARGALPTIYGIALPGKGGHTAAQLCVALAARCGVAASCLALGDVSQSKFASLFHDAFVLPLDEKLQRTLCAFETMMPVDELRAAEVVLVRVSHVRHALVNNEKSVETSFGMPLLVPLPQRASYEAIRTAVLDACAAYVAVDQLERPADAEAVPGVDLAHHPGPDVLGEPVLLRAVSRSMAPLQTLDPAAPAAEYGFDASSHLVLVWDASAVALYDEKRASEALVDAELERLDASASRASEAAGGLHLADCFRLFSSPEVLSESNEWFCTRCEALRPATKSVEIWRTPDVLVVHLKRFVYSAVRHAKLDTHVHFPLSGLDMSEFVTDRRMGRDDCLYDLVGVCNHYGSLGGGHYTAFVRLADRWMSFDDSAVRPIDAASVCTKHAYILVYQRRGAAARSEEAPVAAAASSASRTIVVD